MTTPAQQRRAAEALAILAQTKPLAEAELDEAEIPHWRQRLLDAADRDEEEYGVRHGPNYDRATAAIRAALGREPLPDGPTPPRRPTEPIRYRDPSEPEERF